MNPAREMSVWRETIEFDWEREADASEHRHELLSFHDYHTAAGCDSDKNVGYSMRHSWTFRAFDAHLRSDARLLKQYRIYFGTYVSLDEMYMRDSWRLCAPSPRAIENTC